MRPVSSPSFLAMNKGFVSSTRQNRPELPGQRLETRHPWDVEDLVAGLYVGTYLDTEQNDVLGACIDISTLLSFEAMGSDAGCDGGDSCCSKGKCSQRVMSALDVMDEIGILTIPTSTSKPSSKSFHPLHPFLVFSLLDFHLSQVLHQ